MRFPLRLTFYQFLLGLVVLLAISLRFVGLESLSPPLNRDEAAIGYNAYALLQTGHDEHGQAWPLSFKSIGDYKMPGYIYATILPVWLLGLSAWTVRFWSAAAGVMGVLAMWFLSSEIFKRFPPSLFPSTQGEKQWLFPLLSTFLLAINPWHLHYSRIGFEANLNLSLFLWSLVLAFWMQKRIGWVIGVCLLVVAMQFTYSSTFIFLPLFLGSVGLIWLWELQKNGRRIPMTLATLLPIAIGIGILGLGSFIAWQGVAEVSAAKQAITVFSDPFSVDQFNHLRSELQLDHPLWAKIWMNKPMYFARIIGANYLASFSPGFWFQNRISHPWHAVYGHGFFYALDGLGMLLGLGLLVVIWKKAKPSRWLWVGVLIWLLLSPVAAVITIDAPHATRSLYQIPIVVLLISIGFYGVITQLESYTKIRMRYWFYGLLGIYLAFLSRFIYIYTVLYPHHYDASFFPGIAPVVTYLESLSLEQLVIFDDVSDSPYLYVLFYTAFSPETVYQLAQWKPPDTAGLMHIERLGKYWFVEGEPTVTQKAYWVLRGHAGPPPGFSLDKEFLDPRTGTIEWKVYKN